MKPEAQRIAIAEACGWKTKLVGGRWITRRPDGSLSRDAHKSFGKPESNYYPDYLNDLNAMHDAEKVLDKDQRYHYVTRLVESNKTGGGYIFVTAAQRAESFLRTIGKWIEE